MDAATLAAIGAYTGLVGGIAGAISLLWTVVWSLTARPRARWSLNRFEGQWKTERVVFPPSADGSVPPPMEPVRLDPPHYYFYFRNIGTAAADDAHAVVKGGPWHKKVEFPSTGRRRIEPGEEIVVMLPAKSVEGKLANRRYAAGEDSVLDLKGVRVTVWWRRQSVGFAGRPFWLNKQQFKVPLLGYTPGSAVI